MTDYLQSDPEAQPFKDSYEETLDCQGKRKRLEWVNATYDPIPEEEYYARRREMVTDPVIIDTVKKLRTLIGEKAANAYFMKYLDSLDRKERTKAHYTVR